MGSSYPERMANALDQPVTIGEIARTVAAAGTAVPLHIDRTPISGLHLMAKTITGANTGNVYIGLSTVDKASRQIWKLEPDDAWEPLFARAIDLNDLWIDADNAGDGVTGFYTPA